MRTCIVLVMLLLSWTAEAEITTTANVTAPAVSAELYVALGLSLNGLAEPAEAPTEEAQSQVSLEMLADYGRVVLFSGHLYQVADVPHEYGVYVYTAAKAQGIDPLDLATLLISENSGPALDFSVEGAEKRRYDFDYESGSLGQAGERGIFQVSSRWPELAGYTDEDLHDPEKSAHIAAFVWFKALESHEKCKQKLDYVYHDTSAHWKCAKRSRDDMDPSTSGCRFAQMKFEKLRFSLTQTESPDFTSIGKAHLKRLDKTRKRARKAWNRKQKRLKRRLAKERMLTE